MIRKLTAGILLILMLFGTAMARIEASPVKVDQYGMEPAVWLALIVGIFAMINNIGRFWDKKKQNPELQYDFAYLYTTIMSILMLCMGVLQTQVAELTPAAILGAVIFGFSGNETMARLTKTKR